MLNVLKASNLDKLYSAKVGIEFEFFCEMKDSKIKESLEKLLGKTIIMCEDYHSDQSVDSETFKIEPDRSGGASMKELITGPMDYREARVVITKVLKYIKNNGYTTDKCSIHLNCSFDTSKVGVNFIMALNVLKFCLDFDEDFVYKKFPNRKDSIYARSIKSIHPVSLYIPSIEKIDPFNFAVPNRKYFGVNFTKLSKGYLEFRYIGGENYHEKQEDIFEILDKFLITLYDTCADKSFDVTHTLKLKNILKPLETVVDNLKNAQNFVNSGRTLTVDISPDPVIISSRFPQFNTQLYKLIIDAGLSKCKINWDSDLGKFQIKDAKLTSCFNIQKVDLINCEISGLIENCDLHNCKINNSELKNCNLYKCKVESSKIEDCFTNNKSSATNCYIFGKMGIFNGKMIKCIFRDGSLFKDAKYDEDTEIINFTLVG